MLIWLSPLHKIQCFSDIPAVQQTQVFLGIEREYEYVVFKYVVQYGKLNIAIG